MDSLKKASIVREKPAFCSRRLLSNGSANTGLAITPSSPAHAPLSAMA